MAWSDLAAGFAFYLVLEGLLPFASPGVWRQGLSAMANLDDRKLRIAGLVSMLTGLALLIWVRS